VHTSSVVFVVFVPSSALRVAAAVHVSVVSCFLPAFTSHPWLHARRYCMLLSTCHPALVAGLHHSHLLVHLSIPHDMPWLLDDDTDPSAPRNMAGLRTAHNARIKTRELALRRLNAWRQCRRPPVAPSAPTRPATAQFTRTTSGHLQTVRVVFAVVRACIVVSSVVCAASRATTRVWFVVGGWCVVVHCGSGASVFVQRQPAHRSGRLTQVPGAFCCAVT